MRRLLAILTAAAGGAALLAAAAPAAAHAAVPLPSTCSGVLRVNGFAFDPATVPAGGSAAAALTATNCTGQSQAVTETWTGRFGVDPGSGGIAPGCPVLDPFPRTVTFGPHERITTSTTYTTFAGCTATRLTVTVTITQGGTQLATVSAVLAIR
ncbi:hypothetical protein GA0115240_11267 [Streptomyces sp. DvalAA-14]|uniref:hypothetical protein n=1 Tax=unclassified Streptomyces TaxID=2593676 RepID=UPI00081AF76E|nr:MULTISPECIES: hypothetical protein [unclassified Streptomyces]MYS19744.1 hypothetical protein [Streptomyces sp. SID4948]SCD52120.1 hypothetical protein GA0115240_11267 [Streptomyces sp. DvalAA-14]